MRVILRIFKQVLGRYRMMVLGGYVSVAGAALFALAIPKVLESSVNRLVESESADASQLYFLAVGLILAGVARGLFSFGQTFLGEAVAQRWAYDLRNEYFDRLQHLSFGFHDKQTTGALMSRATADVEGVRMFVNMGAIRAGFVIAMVGGIAVAMMTTDVKLALVSLSFVPLLGWRAVATSRGLRRRWLRVQELTAEMITVLQENLSGIRVVKAFAAEEHERAKFAKSSGEVADETRDAQVVWAGNFSVMNFLFTAAIGAILWVGGSEVLEGRTFVDGQAVFSGFTPGEFTAFIFYMGLLTMPVRMMGWMVNSFSRASSCGERLFAILDAESPVDDCPGAKTMGRVGGRVTFSGVSFRYDGGALALQTIDLDVEPGQTIALLGRPGSGKTTLAHLIPRFYDVTEGCVTIDGTDVRDVTLASLRENVGIVQQDVFIHSMSIGENIAYGAVDVSPERIAEVARVAQLDDFITSLPDGYNTAVGERGIGLSGGQKQRLSIARTLLRDPPIIILDDSTSSVDAQTEHRLQVAVESAIQGRTTFVITHRLSTIRGADVILVFKDGEIVQRGDHEDLIARGGEYRDLYDLQLRPQEEAALHVPGGDGAQGAT